ncbi:PHP domain-containing protein [uncultured Bifidobacterium sp.]|uniref:PHP domain-containing protein n=1 Tax=uncultured Bifidobacterium sp. TaxID=165187 RepID=UPI0026310B4B|nr:PHP domain-containing protein [uncultured Bifidobacterium sp.]
MTQSILAASSVNVGMSAPPASGWDIHCHTVFSDGTCTPRELADLAVRSGLHGVAIADHDTCVGWPFMMFEAERVGLPVLLGTEITSDMDGVSVHMLAFQYDPHDLVMESLFRRTRQARLDRARAMVRALSRDYPITWNLVVAQAHEGDATTIGRPHIADALVAAGVCTDRSEAFSGILSSSSPYYIPTPSPYAPDVVAAVHAAGGVSVIAHAGDRSRGSSLLSDEYFGVLVDAGLDGVEVWHRGNQADQRERLLGLARRWSLLVTGGSDWHGAGKPNLLGENLTGDETVAAIMERGVPFKELRIQPRALSPNR